MEINPVFIIILPRGNMYNENSRGPRTDPCGTPYFTGDKMPPQLNKQSGSDRTGRI